MPNRFICDVLSEMRKCLGSLNLSYMDGLIEEAQSLANRMEAALADKKDFSHYSKRVSELKKQIKELEELTKELPRLREERETLTYSVKRAKHAYNKTTKGGTTKCNECNKEYLNCECPVV